MQLDNQVVCISVGNGSGKYVYIIYPYISGLFWANKDIYHHLPIDKDTWNKNYG